MRERKKQVEWNTPHQKAKIESKKKKAGQRERKRNYKLRRRIFTALKSSKKTKQETGRKNKLKKKLNLTAEEKEKREDPYREDI